eukprot:jgi/Chrpa1/20844/Chrysochromulina_OHIO_Genome00023949-RA
MSPASPTPPRRGRQQKEASAHCKAMWVTAYERCRGAACSRAGRDSTTADDGLRKGARKVFEELFIEGKIGDADVKYSFPCDQTNASEDAAGEPGEKAASSDGVPLQWVECFGGALVLLLRLASLVWAKGSKHFAVWSRRNRSYRNKWLTSTAPPPLAPPSTPSPPPPSPPPPLTQHPSSPPPSSRPPPRGATPRAHANFAAPGREATALQGKISRFACLLSTVFFAMAGFDEMQGIPTALVMLATKPPLPSPPPPSPSPPPSPPLIYFTVSTVTGLTSALANTAVSRIVLAPGTYYLRAELSITRSVVLEAAVAGSVVLNAQGSSSSPRRVLGINPGSSGVVELIGLHITEGYVLGSSYNAALNGGGVFVRVAISSCTISGNTADSYRGGRGGGVFIQDGTVAISSCTIGGNTAQIGGGVFVQGGTVAISSSTISGNTAENHRGMADGNGGGVGVIPQYDAGSPLTMVSIVNSQIHSNSGGGVVVYSGTVTMTSSSIYGNTVYYIYGGDEQCPCEDNVRVFGGTVCSFAMTLTNVYYGFVSTCPAPPPPPPSPPS